MPITFNLHYGQMRPRAKPGTGHRDNNWQNYVMEKIETSPKKSIQCSSIRDLTQEGGVVQYTANALGNVEVTNPKHLHALSGLGYPQYTGDGTWPVNMEDLLWPDPIGKGRDDPYDTNIFASIRQRVGL